MKGSRRQSRLDDTTKWVDIRICLTTCWARISLAKLLLSAFVILTFCGFSDHVEFERTTSQLKQGMSKREVRQLFPSFRLIDETNHVSKINSATTWYATNNEYASKLQFCSKMFPQWCVIYFDTNDIIAAQYYNPPGNRTAQAIKPPK